MKNRKREICTSGSVRDEDGNILVGIIRSPIRASILPDRSCCWLCSAAARTLSITEASLASGEEAQRPAHRACSADTARWGW